MLVGKNAHECVKMNVLQQLMANFDGINLNAGKFERHKTTDVKFERHKNK